MKENPFENSNRFFILGGGSQREFLFLLKAFKCCSSTFPSRLQGPSDFCNTINFQIKRLIKVKKYLLFTIWEDFHRHFSFSSSFAFFYFVFDATFRGWLKNAASSFLYFPLNEMQTFIETFIVFRFDIFSLLREAILHMLSVCCIKGKRKRSNC